MRILIVDDNARVRKTLHSLLHHLCTESMEAADGISAVEFYRRYRPDVVLMDVRMPRMNGIEATACIRSMDPEARVLMVTEYDDASLRHNAEFAGAMGYYLKEELMDLRRFLEALADTLADEKNSSFGIYLS